MLLLVISGGSFCVFIGCLAGLPVIVGRLPENFFLEPGRPWYRFLAPLLYTAVLVVKNILGVFLILLGIVMLFAPGQGLLTLAVGLALINFPGKRRLVFKLLSIERLRWILNWIRRKKGVAEFRFPLKSSSAR